AYVPAWQRCATATVVLWDYLSVSLLPIRLSADDSFNQVAVVERLGSSAFLGSVAALAVGVCLLWVLPRRFRALKLGALFWLASLAVVANLLFPIGTIRAERHLYLPSVGLCLAGGAMMAQFTRVRSQRWVNLALLLLLTMFSARTVLRNRDWR